MNALPFIWNDPVKYKNHIVMVGIFYLVCAYFKMVGKKTSGSGLSDALLQGSWVQVLSKGYLVEAIRASCALT